MFKTKTHRPEMLQEKLASHYKLDCSMPDFNERLYDVVLKDLSIDERESAQRDVARLTRYLDRLEHDICAVESSRAWRIGYQIMHTAKRLLGRSTQGDGFKAIHETLELYHHWKKARD